jgi:Ser/Thr protein kinase RdoA (MazF antagonist)
VSELKTSFYGLEPEIILEAIESQNLRPTGELRQLNSYENRVFEVLLENDDRKVIKFYRPGRWNAATIQEEHDFLWELWENDIPVVPPERIAGQTLHQHAGLLYTVFPKAYGRMPDEILPQETKSVGRLLAQVHMIGADRDFQDRPELGFSPYTPEDTLDQLHKFVVPEMWPRYRDAAEELIERFETEIDPSTYQRIHGDFHRGNLLSNKDGFLLVDFDDCMHGPIIQDFWMILQSLTPDEKEMLVRGYEELREFPDEQLPWVPVLRGFRILNYAGWIARRWDDPSFPRIFPDFGTYTYWAEETEALESILRGRGENSEI